MTKYVTTIGLEVHAELKTQTKMFCDCRNNPDEERPNANVCPICMGHPGTLPTLNKQAIKNVLKVGLAVGGKIADFTEWDRKNYFYPDIPKGYQISQYKYPLVSGGAINGVDITRIHLEEDTGTSQHKGEFSLVNYNRAGVPLMELVTEPVIHSAEQAGNFARELQLLLRTLGVSDSNMEKGEMRVEVNVSIAPEGATKFGTKVEVKNINSFKAAEKSIEFEVARMTALLDAGEGDKIVQETRGWDETKQKTFSQRIKETSDDYRYFPEPDLPKLKISEIPEFADAILRAELPELPWEKRARFISLGLTDQQAEFFVQSEKFGTIFDEILKKQKDAKIISLSVNYLSSDLASIVKTAGDSVFEKVNAENFAKLIAMVAENKISSRGAKDILAVLAADGGDPEKIAAEKGLLQNSDPKALEKLAAQIIAENEKSVAEFRAGKETAIKFLMGCGMKMSKGSANPQALEETLKKLILQA